MPEWIRQVGAPRGFRSTLFLTRLLFAPGHVGLAPESGPVLFAASFSPAPIGLYTSRPFPFALLFSYHLSHLTILTPDSSVHHSLYDTAQPSFGRPTLQPFIRAVRCTNLPHLDSPD